MSGNRLSSISQILFCFITVKTKTTPFTAAPISRVEGASLLRELSTTQPENTTAPQASATWKASDGGLGRKNLLFQLKLHLK